MDDQSSVVKIFHARGGEKEMRIIAEASVDGIRFFQNSRIVKIKIRTYK